MSEYAATSALRAGKCGNAVSGPQNEVVDDTRDNGDIGDRQDYITGLRGILVVESFFWTYFLTFIPAIVSSQTAGPGYQDIIRAILSVPLWNESLIYNFFIILSLRVVALPFLNNPTGCMYAQTIIRRIVRLVILAILASGISDLIFTQIGHGYIDNFKEISGNHSLRSPTIPYDILAALNSMFNIFWLTSDFYEQAANAFWPTGTLWVSSVVYYESFTVFYLMVILPFTRQAWHPQLLILFALGSFWMQSWGWYAATGLLFADISTSPILRAGFQAGYSFGDRLRIPYWVAGVIILTVGVALKYVFTIFPRLRNAELVLHPYLDLSQNTDVTQFASAGPYPRFDDWLVITSILVIVESFRPVQNLLSSKLLVGLGKRSFSIFASQCIIYWTVGIKLWLILNTKVGLSVSGSNIVVFIVCFLIITIASEVVYRLIDRPSHWMAQQLYSWLVD